MKIVGMIPARYESSRFPGKPLAEIAGKTLIERVWNQSVKAIDRKDLYVLTDDERIRDHCLDKRMQCLMTSSECLTGTDRLYEASLVIKSDIYINIQGDEPLINPSDIKRMVSGGSYSNRIRPGLDMNTLPLATPPFEETCRKPPFNVLIVSRYASSRLKSFLS